MIWLGAIDPTLPPTVEEFRKMFPEFSGSSDETIQFYLDIGMGWVDPSFWFVPDVKIAAMMAAAHYLYKHDMIAGGQLTGTGTGGAGGGPVDPEIGKVWVRAVRFRDRMVSYARVNAPSSIGGGGGSGKADATEFWASTPYGNMYLSYLRRNAPHIAVI